MTANGYPQDILTKKNRKTDNHRAQQKPTGTAIIPYAPGISEKLRRIGNKFGIRTAFRSITILRKLFTKTRTPNKISEWAKTNKMNFNEYKSKVMLLSRRKRKEPKDIQIYLNRKPLEQVNSIKYLGIIFDNKLFFTEHVNYVAEKCSKLIFTLAKSAKLNWGLKHEPLKIIYKGGILPLLLYGAPVWKRAMEKACYEMKLIRVQRLMNIRIAKAYRTVSSDALCVLTGLTPIPIKIDEFVKLYECRNGRSINGMEVDSDLKLKHWPHPADSIKFHEESKGHAHWMQIYTDGSKNSEGVGSGIAIFNESELTHQLQYKLNEKCSNNQAEQMAILKALDYVVTSENNCREVTIHTDSRITIESLKNRHNHRFLIEEIRKKVTEMEKQNWKIEFNWVKAHVGILGNEIADRLAKEAAISKTLKECYSKIPISVIASELSEVSVTKWQSEWNETSKGSVTKSFFPNIFERLKMKINLTPNFTTMVTGHGNIRSYLHRFKILDNPACACSNGDQTVDHLLFECKLLEQQRHKLMIAVLTKGDWPVSKNELIMQHLKDFIAFTNSISFENL